MNRFLQILHFFGWVKLHRSILNHWIWRSNECFSQGQAWIDLVLFAAYKDEAIYVNKQLIKIHSGQQVRSQETLAERWKWTRGKVRHFIKHLVDDGMITTKRVGNNLVITICNYGNYQNEDPKTNGNISEVSQSTTNEQQKQLPMNNLCTDFGANSIKEVKNKRSKERNKNNFLKRDMQLDESLRKISERKARAAQKIICKFFFDHLDENKLQRVWNELGLIQVAEISPPAKQQAYLRYREFIERYHGDDVFSPLVDNLEHDEELDSYQSSFTESQLLTILPTPTFWVCSYLVNSFQDYITEYHRGKNPNQWVADIDFAFNRETYRKVTDKNGEDFHYQINEVPFIRGLKVNQ